MMLMERTEKGKALRWGIRNVCNDFFVYFALLSFFEKLIVSFYISKRME